MKETTPAAMPPCFDRWCKRFDDIWRHLAQKREFRNYIGGLLEKRQLKYLGGLAKNRKVGRKISANELQEIRLDKLAESLPNEAFTPVKINLDKPKTVCFSSLPETSSRCAKTYPKYQKLASRKT